MGTEKLCACDRTRQSPLCANIDFVDTVKEPFLTIVRSLSDVQDGVWLSPFRGIPVGRRFRDSMLFISMMTAKFSITL